MGTASSRSYEQPCQPMGPGGYPKGIAAAGCSMLCTTPFYWSTIAVIFGPYVHFTAADLGTAGVRVHVDPKDPARVKYASAHDLRRAFGERWAARIMPAQLKELMRHESIETTLRYSVGTHAERAADACWDAFDRATSIAATAPVVENSVSGACA